VWAIRPRWHAIISNFSEIVGIAPRRHCRAPFAGREAIG
jgi:hypothetical protein